MANFDAIRIRETVIRSESKPTHPLVPYVRKPQTRFGTMGVTTEAIASGATGTITEYAYDWSSSSMVATGATQTVFNYFSTSIASGTKVICLFVGGQMCVVAVDCST